MKILLVGDVVGRPGRHALQAILPQLREDLACEFVIVNGENSAAGYGITERTACEIFDAGADCITTGNHVWAQKEAEHLLEIDRRILRPANYPPGAPGIGHAVFETGGGQRVGVINLLGRIFMETVDCPFRVGSKLVDELVPTCDAVIVDFHAEATSEKTCLAYYLDGRATAVIGTHTHVQTADAQVFPGGTVFISDVGMTGPLGTCIGVKPEIVLRRFLSGMPARFDVPKGGPAFLSAVLITTGPARGLPAAIEAMRILTNGAEQV